MTENTTTEAAEPEVTADEVQTIIVEYSRRIENTYSMLRRRTLAQRYGVDTVELTTDDTGLLIILAANEMQREQTPAGQDARDQLERFENMTPGQLSDVFVAEVRRRRVEHVETVEATFPDRGVDAPSEDVSGAGDLPD